MMNHPLSKYVYKRIMDKYHRREELTIEEATDKMNYELQQERGEGAPADWDKYYEEVQEEHMPKSVITNTIVSINSHEHTINLPEGFTIQLESCQIDLIGSPLLEKDEILISFL